MTKSDLGKLLSSASSPKKRKRVVTIRIFLVVVFVVFFATTTTAAMCKGEKRDSSRSNNNDDDGAACSGASTTWDVKKAVEGAKDIESRMHSKGELKTDGFTVLLNTFKRRDLLKRALKHYVRCENVEHIRVVWSEQTAPPNIWSKEDAKDFFAEPPAKKRGGGGAVQQAFVRYDWHPTTSIQNRFTPLENLPTEAVFHVDDDVRIPCNKLSLGFQTWKKNKNALVGYFPRSHAKRGAQAGNACELRYVWNDFELFFMSKSKYSIALTKAAFSHAKYLGVYEKFLPIGVREYVDKRKNCEDIAMQMLVSSIVNEMNSLSTSGEAYSRHSSAVAVSSGWAHYLAGKIDSLFVDGISSGQGHHEERSGCVDDFSRMFGRSRSPLGPF